MSENQGADGVPAEHVFTVTHYIRPAGNIGGWSQTTSAEGSADDARQFIADREEEAARLGLQDAQPVADGQEQLPDADGQGEPAGDGQDDAGAADGQLEQEPE